MRAAGDLGLPGLFCGEKSVPPKRVAQSASDPSTFDIDGFISGFKPALVSAKLHKRGDLIPVLSDLLTRLQALKDDEAAQVERGWSEGDPLTELGLEYNRLQAEFEAGGYEEFLFRPMTGALEKKLLAAHQKSPHKDDDEWLTWRAMSATCVTKDADGNTQPRVIPMSAWPALRDRVGELPFAPVVKAFMDAYSGGGVTAPFLPWQPPTQETETP